MKRLVYEIRKWKPGYTRSLPDVIERFQQDF
jgi:hypothetical protein